MVRVTRSRASASNAPEKRGKIPPPAMIPLTTSLKALKGGIKKASKSKLLKKQGILKALQGELENGETTPTPLVPCVGGDVLPPLAQTQPAFTTATTNTPLISPPDTSKVVYSSDAKAITAVLAPSTTSDILKKGIEHLLKVEPKLAELTEKFQCGVFSKEGLEEVIDPFRSLISGIISQQVSGAAAKSIKAKFINLFAAQLEDNGLDFPTPAMVLGCEHATLRTAGLSLRKAEYVHSLSEHFINGELSTEILIKASDQEVVEKLTKVRGLGVWSAEMFLIFALKRMDVFSTGDLGIQRGMAAFMGRDVSKLKTAAKGAKGGGKWKYMSEADMIKHSEKFSPYRSLFMWYMWKASDITVDALSDDGKRKKKVGGTNSRNDGKGKR